MKNIMLRLVFQAKEFFKSGSDKSSYFGPNFTCILFGSLIFMIDFKLFLIQARRVGVWPGAERLGRPSFSHQEAASLRAVGGLQCSRYGKLAGIVSLIKSELFYIEYKYFLWKWVFFQIYFLTKLKNKYNYVWSPFKPEQGDMFKTQFQGDAWHIIIFMPIGVILSITFVISLFSNIRTSEDQGHLPFIALLESRALCL